MSDEINHSCIASAFERLVESARNHDRQALLMADSAIDMCPSLILRGISFLGECLEAYDDAPPMQIKLARSTIQEVTALCAALLDAQCLADTYRQIESQAEGAA